MVFLVFLQTFAREIDAWATRIYAFAHARVFDRGEEGETQPAITWTIMTKLSRKKVVQLFKFKSAIGLIIMQTAESGFTDTPK